MKDFFRVFVLLQKLQNMSCPVLTCLAQNALLEALFESKKRFGANIYLMRSEPLVRSRLSIWIDKHGSVEIPMAQLLPELTTQLLFSPPGAYYEASDRLARKKSKANMAPEQALSVLNKLMANRTWNATMVSYDTDKRSKATPPDHVFEKELAAFEAAYRLKLSEAKAVAT